jgi:DNA-binding winged helix-turn-helix (wHTH) protein/tetratricopeptide (TPR) repeat protein
MDASASHGRFMSPATRASDRDELASFAGHVFDVAHDQLSRGGTLVRLSPKARTLLSYLLRHPDRVLGKEDLMTAVWGPTVVTDDSLVQLVAELRNALKDREQAVVKTVPRRGYMLVAPVQWRQKTHESQEASAAPSGQQAPRRPWVAAATAGLVCTALAGGLVLVTRDRNDADSEIWGHAPRALNSQSSVDADFASLPAVFVAPFAEVDRDGRPSQFGQRLADYISSQFVNQRRLVLTPEAGAKVIVIGRLLRPDAQTVVVDVQMKDLSSGVAYPLVQGSYKSEEEIIRSDLHARIIHAMKVRRDEIILARARRPGHEPSAVELMQLAWSDYNLAKNEADYVRAGSRFEAVLLKDPESFHARFGRTLSCIRAFTRLYSPSPDERLAACELLAQELYSFAPERPDAMQMMAVVLHYRGHSEEALWLMRKSLEIEPRHRMGNAATASMLVKAGRFDEAAPHVEYTRALAERRKEHGPADNRRQAAYYVLFAEYAFFQGRDDEAYEWMRRMAAEMPGWDRSFAMLAAIDALHGRDEEARAHMARHRALVPNSTVRYIQRLYPSSDPVVLAHRERLLEGLRKAGLPEGS